MSLILFGFAISLTFAQEGAVTDVDGNFKITSKSLKKILNWNSGTWDGTTRTWEDDDGWEDLIITREWNSILFLKNMNGERIVSQDSIAVFRVNR